MRNESPVPKSPIPTAQRKRYVSPQVWEMGPLEAESVIEKIEAVNPRCGQRLRGTTEVPAVARARFSAGNLALLAVALVTTAALLVVPILVVADYVSMFRLHYANLSTAGAVVVGWIVCCLALALGPGWLLDALPGILDRSYGPRALMLLIAVNLIAGFAVLYRWSTVPPWAP